MQKYIYSIVTVQICTISITQMYFFQIYTIIIAQMYFCTIVHRLMWVYFGLIGKFYTIIVAIQMNILEIIYIENSGFWLRKREMI